MQMGPSEKHSWGAHCAPEKVQFFHFCNFKLYSIHGYQKSNISSMKAPMFMKFKTQVHQIVSDYQKDCHKDPCMQTRARVKKVCARILDLTSKCPQPGELRIRIFFCKPKNISFLSVSEYLTKGAHPCMWDPQKNFFKVHTVHPKIGYFFFYFFKL